MKLRARTINFIAVTASLMGPLSYVATAQGVLNPRTMKQLGEVDPRFLSFNVETVEITGGRFWKPYKSAAASAAPEAKPGTNQPIGMDPNLFEYRPPINLANPRLRKLAAALGPSFLRVSGTWRNSTYFQNNDEPAPATPPAGYKGVMTRAEWKGVIDFSRAVNADLVTSVATSDGTRDAAGVWTAGEADEFFSYTQSLGAHITATEFMNEPTFAAIGGAPKDYDAAAYAKDVKVFAAFLRRKSPGTIFLGPGSVGEGVTLLEGAPMPKMISSEDMMKATGPAYDAFSYHFYGTVSRRCAGPAGAGMNEEKALSTAWFDRNTTVEAFYERLRDLYLPGKPIWLTETGEAACGGDPWASTFLDSFRFMDQLGALAQRGVKTVMVNTLAASDYGLLDEDTLTPRPDYWAALLWKHLMGTRVLAPGVANPDGVRMYAQCMQGQKGGVAVLIDNPSQTETVLEIPLSGERYTLSTTDIHGQTTFLNGTELKTSDEGSVPKLSGAPFKQGLQHFAPLTITLLTMPAADNASCE